MEEVHDEGGIQSLYDMLQKVQRMSKNNLDLIEEGFNALEEENEQDALLSREYGKRKLLKKEESGGGKVLCILVSSLFHVFNINGKSFISLSLLVWSRPSSQSLTHNLLTAGTKYNDTVQAAQKADRVVQAKVNNWGKAIEMLSLSKEEIPSHLPSMSKSEQDESGPVLAQLLSQARDRITQLDTVQENRITLEKEAITLSEEDDISTDLMKKANELTKGSPIVKLEPEQFGDVFESHLEKYQQFQYKMQSFVSTQQDLIYQLEDLIGKLDSLKSSIPTLYKRETAIMHLETAFVKFKEIRANLVEGIKVSDGDGYLGILYLLFCFSLVLFQLYRYTYSF